VIYLVDGTLGAGKTYYALRQIEAALGAGKVVVTNVTLRDDWAERVARGNPARRISRTAIARRAELYRSRLLVADSLADVMRVRVHGKGEGRAVVVLDEAHRWLNARLWNAGRGRDQDPDAIVRGDVVSWLSSTRHYGMDVYLISQHIEDIDKQVRNRVEYRVRLRNLKRVKVAGVRVFPCNVFVAISELVSARQAPVAHRDYYLLSKRIAGMYDTHELAAHEVPPDAIWLPAAGASGGAAGAAAGSGETGP
jgi:zona occludens toxin (predicted ATPase)